MSEVIFAVLICLWVYLSHQYSQLQAKTAVLETKLLAIEKVTSKIVEVESSDVEPGVYFPHRDKEAPDALDVLYGKRTPGPVHTQQQILDSILNLKES